jgi:hypothetical protein
MIPAGSKVISRAGWISFKGNNSIANQYFSLVSLIKVLEIVTAYTALRALAIGMFVAESPGAECEIVLRSSDLVANQWR